MPGREQSPERVGDQRNRFNASQFGNFLAVVSSGRRDGHAPRHSPHVGCGVVRPTQGECLGVGPPTWNTRTQLMLAAIVWRHGAARVLFQIETRLSSVGTAAPAARRHAQMAPVHADECDGAGSARGRRLSKRDWRKLGTLAGEHLADARVELAVAGARERARLPRDR